MLADRDAQEAYMARVSERCAKSKPHEPQESEFIKAICPEPFHGQMAEDIARVCFAAPNPSADGLDSRTSVGLAIAENPRNATLSIPISSNPTEAPAGRLELAMYTSKFWANGTNLRIRFLSGSDWQKSKVKQYAPNWCNYGNFTMQFIDSGDTEILIDFNPTGGSWSYKGTDCRYWASQGKPTMNLGWILQERSEDELRQVIMHEFGHALGAIHEHQSPYENIPWNKEAVYTSLGGPPNFWPRDKVDQNMFVTYTLDQVQATPFDPKSIMLYFYPPSWTLDGKGTSFNTELSDLDKSYINFCYPKALGDVGLFNTQEVRPWDQPRLNNSIQKSFTASYTSPPQVAVALNWLDIAKEKNLRILADATNTTASGLTCNLNSWADTTLYSAGMTYLDIGPSRSYFQTGTFSTREIEPVWQNTRPKNSKRINFARPYTSGTPNVVCFIKMMDFGAGYNVRLTVYPSSIDQNGFTANIDTWSDSKLWGAVITWISYPTTQADVAGGTFDTSQIRRWDQPNNQNSALVPFSKTFSKVPKLMMGLNKLDYACTSNLRFRCSTSSVSTTNFVANLQGWADSVMYSSGISYLAFV